jgi:dihydroorotate dehydrogenase
MGLYGAIGRPALFVLRPEAAHRVAHALLSLPLPWSRVGGVPADPRLDIDLAGIPLRNPIGLAAGFDKACAHLGPLGALGFGYVIGGTVTRRPRRGHPAPRIVRDERARSLVNAMGLPNPGAHAVARALRSTARTAPRVVSIADEAVADVLDVHTVLEPLVDAVELNASCPNVSWGRDRDNEEHLATLVRELGRRRAKPLFVKLPRFESDVEREVVLALARIAVAEGVDGLTCSNSLPVRDSRLSVGAGGLSGLPLAEATPRMVRDVNDAIAAEVPINACGGVFTAEHVLACVEAGARTVQLYTSLVFEGPRVVRAIVEGLLAALDARRADVASRVGAA